MRIHLIAVLNAADTLLLLVHLSRACLVEVVDLRILEAHLRAEFYQAGEANIADLVLC